MWSDWHFLLAAPLEGTDFEADWQAAACALGMWARRRDVRFTSLWRTWHRAELPSDSDAESNEEAAEVRRTGHSPVNSQHPLTDMATAIDHVIVGRQQAARQMLQMSHLSLQESDTQPTTSGKATGDDSASEQWSQQRKSDAHEHQQQNGTANAAGAASPDAKPSPASQGEPEASTTDDDHAAPFVCHLQSVKLQQTQIHTSSQSG